MGIIYKRTYNDVTGKYYWICKECGKHSDIGYNSAEICDKVFSLHADKSHDAQEVAVTEAVGV